MYKYFLLLTLVLALLTGCAGVPTTAAVAPVDSKSTSQTSSATAPASNSSDSPVSPVSSDPAKKVYLTFDDGPNSHFTGQVLDILKKFGVKATFCVVGTNIERNPDVLKRIVEEGHTVVNHTQTHDYKKIYASPEAFLADLKRGNQSIAAVTGSEVKIFRAPGGPTKLNKSYFELLTKHGYKSLSWNVASNDTDPKGVSPEQLIDNVEKGVIRIENMKKTPIILMHDGTEINMSADKPGTAVHTYIHNRESDVAALPAIIEFLQAKGYTFAGVDEKTPAAW